MRKPPEDRRDFFGYGGQPPDANWPGEARVAQHGSSRSTNLLSWSELAKWLNAISV